MSLRGCCRCTSKAHCIHDRSRVISALLTGTSASSKRPQPQNPDRFHSRCLGRDFLFVLGPTLYPETSTPFRSRCRFLGSSRATEKRGTFRHLPPTNPRAFLR